MENASLKPFIKEHLDILFVGLNPARGSNDNMHYFSVNQSFWQQLADAGLINEIIDKVNADVTVFGSNEINYMGWYYGITDLVTETAESKSSKIKILDNHNKKLSEVILFFKPKVVILLHHKATNSFLKYHHISPQKANCGCLGKIISDCDSLFYSIGFPHGNNITSVDKVAKYKEVKEYINNIKDE